MSNRSKLFLPGGRPRQVRRVRNARGEAHMCCWHKCHKLSDDNFQIRLKHPQPRWKNPITGEQEMLIYTFCSDQCRQAFAKGTPFENRV
jgi:hypothetical protein